ncbi:MAG: hypothetical protein PF572_03010 [Patescibacteria group bacterium]|jgi:hypothetical protein|nr:hypothetical protein [Patescibacteria group bacterium]
MAGKWVQISIYDDNYLDPKTGEKYRTMLADYKCSECSSIETGYPENLEGPPKCICANMSMQEIQKMKKNLVKSEKRVRLAVAQ